MDRALLEARVPILFVDKIGTMTLRPSHRPSGAGTEWTALVKGEPDTDGCVVKLDRGSILTVNGNLLNLANGVSANVNGYLFSIGTGSTLNLNGALFSLEGNSILRLTSEAFGIFVGEGTNTLKLANNLCTGGTSAC